MSFSALGLSDSLLRAIADQGYEQPTRIQEEAIPVVLAGKDVLASAQTGTGKTAAFTLPILERLKGFASNSPSPARHPVRALMLTPTRELAAQVEESIRVYGKYLPFRTAVIYGGVNIDPQLKQLQAGVDLLVATPGRLLDHLTQRNVNLSQVQMLVLDEADRMLDMGFLPDLRRILDNLPAQRQNLLFSATFSNDIRKLADAFLNAPVVIEVARRNATSDAVTQAAYDVPATRKKDLLIHLIRETPLNQVLVFTRTKQSAGRLATQLERAGINAAAIHGDKTQQARQQALDGFKQGQVNVLVGTDVAARGIDIDQLPCVINYELPPVPEDYVHRIGRTGRGGATGQAISLISEDEVKFAADIEKLLKKPLERRTLPPTFRPTENSASERPRRLEPTPMPAAPVLHRPPPARTAPAERLPALMRSKDAAPTHLAAAPNMPGMRPLRRSEPQLAALLRKFPDPVPDEV